MSTFTLQRQTTFNVLHCSGYRLVYDMGTVFVSAFVCTGPDLLVTSPLTDCHCCGRNAVSTILRRTALCQTCLVKLVANPKFVWCDICGRPRELTVNGLTACNPYNWSDIRAAEALCALEQPQLISARSPVLEKMHQNLSRRLATLTVQQTIPNRKTCKSVNG